MIAAGIDIGTNTILMVIAEQNKDGTFTVLHDVHRIPRLGQGVDHTGMIAESALQRAEEVLSEYRMLLDAVGSPPTICVGTSALRDATNREDVVARLFDAIKAPIWVIDGVAEAELTFVGTVGHHSDDAIVIDIGGGSTEYVKGQLGKPTFSTSVNIGALRLAERFLLEYPPSGSAVTQMSEHISKELDDHLAEIRNCGVPTWVAAGTPVALATLSLGLEHYDRSRIEGYQLTVQEVEQHANRLLSMKIEDLHKLTGVSTNRADILPAGALILLHSMKYLGLNHVTVSTQGLRYGIMMVAAAETT